MLTWGRGTSGQLGHGEMINSLYPMPVTSLQDYFITHVSAGWSHSGFVSGSFSCNFSVRSGVVMLILIPNLLSLKIAFDICYSFIILDGGCLFTCGDGSFGQLGHGEYRSHCSPVRVSHFLNEHVKQIACGMRHSLVLLEGKYAW